MNLHNGVACAPTNTQPHLRAALLVFELPLHIGTPSGTRTHRFMILSHTPIPIRLWEQKRKRENLFLSQLPINYHFTSCILRGNRNIHLISGAPLQRHHRTRMAFWSSCHFENGDCIARSVIWKVKGAKSLRIFERTEKTH